MEMEEVTNKQGEYGKTIWLKIFAVEVKMFPFFAYTWLKLKW